MEALILSCGTGGGHDAAGRAVAEALERRGHRVTFMDPYQLAGEGAAERVGNLYIRLVQRSPRLFGCFYALGEIYRRLPLRSPVYWANGKLAGAMQQYLSRHDFDCIIMTHMFPAQILAHLKGRMPLPKTMLIATDYTCIPFMEETACDFYAIPAPDLCETFRARGIPAEKIVPCGIPVRRAFSEACGRAQARARLGLPQEGRCILLSGGSIGAGRMTEAVAVLEPWLRQDKNSRLLIVCGKNRKLYEKLREKYAGNVQMQVMESTEQMAAYMKACDVLISKPGGLSSTEAAVAGIPLVHISPIPGCETHNAAYFSRHGMSVLVRRPRAALLPALESLQERGRLQAMAAAQARAVSPYAAEAVCDCMEQAVENPEQERDSKPVFGICL